MKQRHKVLFTQLQTYRSDILGVLENVSEEEAEFVPKDFKNNIRWNLGHIYLDQYLWIEDVTQEKADIPHLFHSFFGFGTSPASFNAETPLYEELKTYLANQPSRIKELYSNRLEEEFAPTEIGIHTIEQALIRTIFHEGMHLQTIIDIKKHLRN